MNPASKHDFQKWATGSLSHRTVIDDITVHEQNANDTTTYVLKRTKKGGKHLLLVETISATDGQTAPKSR